MKKELIITFILLISTVLFINVNNYYTYTKSVNSFVNNVVEEISTNYPDVNEEEIIKIINNEKNYEMNVLKKYGFTNNDISILGSMNKTYTYNLVISLLILLLVIMVILVLYLRKSYKNKKEIKNIISYLKDLNNGKYNLDIVDNSEGLISILKNEIYTTTIILREKALRELDDKKKLKDSLSNISHQLKTPLTSILIMIDNLIDEDMDKETQKEFLNDIRYQIENINYLILAMLKLSRFDANVIKFKKEEINIEKLLNECIKNIDIIRDLKDIKINLKGDKTAIFKGDFKWEVEALTNIIKNSIEYTPEHKNIYISYEDNSIVTKIVIEDEGKGIKKEDIEHIFERFYKGVNSDSNSFGIGLSLAKEIIEQDGGTIKVSTSSKGTKFTIKYYH